MLLLIHILNELICYVNTTGIDIQFKKFKLVNQSFKFIKMRHKRNQVGLHCQIVMHINIIQKISMH